MATIDDLMKDPTSYVEFAAESFDPLSVSDLLQECSVLDVKISTLTSRVGVILDLRTSISLGDGNAALLIVGETRSVEWMEEVSSVNRTGRFGDDGFRQRKHLHTSVGSTPRRGKDRFDIEIPCNPRSVLKLSGDWAVFIEGNIDSIGESQPDLGLDTDELIETRFPQWSSVLKPIYATSTIGFGSN
ncbi:hypothetical protein [Rhodococcus sp. OK302]|uniref:hypothetical protein n=1 Tax=Rhodococcus sp. OK302 TaxID=1882769 RepID=UPI000B9EFF96|nr:hypothetical protein [Rhodococcus sp. OK302]OYD71379.1 hypothetical protein BDB13_5049 [Rhodococcus sp. OK302]